MIRILRKLLADSRGNTLAIFAAALVPLVAVIGSGLDLSFAYMAKAKLQNACDAAVLAGRQSMDGNFWGVNPVTGVNKDEVEARKFFDFNFPAGTMRSQSVNFTVDKDPVDSAQILGVATAEVPTSLMHIFGFETIAIQANCDAKRDLGHNDVMLVLDTTGSMNSPPNIGGDTKIKRLRNGAAGLYRALDDTSNGSITRFGIVSYSVTVNVARSLRNMDILRDQEYRGSLYTWEECNYNWGWLSNCRSNGVIYENESDMPYLGQNGSKYGRSVFSHKGNKKVHIDETKWARSSSTTEDNIRRFRESGQGCIEERSSVGQSFDPITILQTVSQADIDAVAADSNQTALQWGRYDPDVQEDENSSACPAEAQKLKVYSSQQAFNTAINNAAPRGNGNTYHDIGMLWGARFLSPTGMFSADNPTSHGIVPVNRHIVFMTDGELVTTDRTYSAYGVDRYHRRISGWESLQRKHINRFHSICDRVKASGATIWVIALDVNAIDDIDDCATSPAHFYTSDGSDLEQIFERIGRGIGNLRLTR